MRPHQCLRHAPLALTTLRMVLAPVMLAAALVRSPASVFAVCLVAAFLSDVFDGVVARRLHVATPALRRLDSLADSVFYLAALAAAWVLHPVSVTSRWTVLTALGMLEALRYVIDWIKFRREASYHMWSSKAWGILLFASFFGLLAMNVDTVLIDVTLYVGILADIEGIAISFLLRTWRTDVHTFVHALTFRKTGAA